MIARYALSMGVIGKGFDYPTVRDLTAAANPDHPFKLHLKGRQLSHAPVHVFQVAAGNLVDRLTGTIRLIGKVQQVADRTLREAQFAAMLDEAETRPMRRAV